MTGLHSALDRRQGSKSHRRAPTRPILSHPDPEHRRDCTKPPTRSGANGGLRKSRVLGHIQGNADMKLYMNPVSTASRPIYLFLAEHHIPAEVITVSLLKGEQLTPDYAKINPNKAVPVLVEEDFVLTESSAILKY